MRNCPGCGASAIRYVKVDGNVVGCNVCGKEYDRSVPGMTDKLAAVVAALAEAERAPLLRREEAYRRVMALLLDLLGAIVAHLHGEKNDG